MALRSKLWRLVMRFFLIALVTTHCLARVSQSDLRSTLVAEHSRKTHRDHREVPEGHDDQTFAQLLGSVEDLQQKMKASPTANVIAPLQAFTDQFAKSAQARGQNDDFSAEMGGKYNRFSTTSFDANFKTHSLCESWNSGGQSDNLEWSESADRLLRIIGNGVVKNGYNMFMAPGQSQGLATNVSVAVYIESMSSFKAQTMDFEVDMYLAMGWYDRRLAHNCTHPILITHKFIADRLWQPDLYFVNSKFAYLQEVTAPNFMVIVYPDGLIFKSMRIDVTLSCMMDLQRFPMDKQECPLVIQSYAYIENILNLTWHEEPPNFPIGSNTEIKLNDMVITNTRTEKCSGPYPMFRGHGNWSCIRAFIVMKRLVLFHIIQTYIPTGMLVSISWMSFWLDPRASPARISLTITSLLTLTTMSNGARQDLPQVSYIKALDIWLTFSQALIFLVLLEYSFVSYYMTKRNLECPHRAPPNYVATPYSHNNNVAQSPSGEDVRVKKSVDELLANEHYARYRAESPVANIRNRHTSIDSGHPHAKAVNSYSMTTGLSHCMNSTAILCHAATAPSTVKVTRSSWSDLLEAEHTALMAATPHGGAHLYSKFDSSKPCQKCANENEMIARQIDKYSRSLFPAAFACFSFTYWWYYDWLSLVLLLMQVARASWMEEIGWAHQLRSGKRSMKIVAMLSSVKILRFGDLVKLYRIVRCLTMVLVYWTIFFKSVSGNLFGSFEIVLLSSFSNCTMRLLTLGRPVARLFSTSSAVLAAPLHGADGGLRSHPIAAKTPKITDMKSAFSAVRSGDQIFVHANSATPAPMLKGLWEHVKENNLKNITTHGLLLDGDVPWNNTECDGVIRSNHLFTGATCRKSVNEGRADFNSVFLSDTPLLFRRGAIKLNVAILHVSPPDANGFCSLGTCVDCSRAAWMTADHVIAMVNKNMPRTFGDSIIHSSNIDVMVRDDSFALPELPVRSPGEQEAKIGKLIAENLVDDGATLQMGIGGIPDAVLPALKNHRDLGIHTEMFSDGALDLIARGVVNNKLKKIIPGKILTTFVYGTRKLYDFLDDNPMVEFGDVQWVNDPSIIRQNPKVTAINSCVEIDLTGQVVSDSVGKKFLSGFGGQVDYIRGAALSNDGLGRPIIAMPSTTNKGETKIVPFLSEGGGVVTTRAHVHYVVTDFGIAQLWGKNMRQRAYELIQIAHPDHRESLEKSAFERLKVMPSAD
ncbi:hypothetical protein QR680_006344 [Steinernema hermaphroditum]|uniref:Acetyl-CoA hydrolase n=1 Tax=Steinernema hermaphroditum TaxID=289476 RepID=A0AA39LWZ4_9BILA|nr:hypothetical protein QR680_006344 [Steinernema hermaphroditum]